MRGVLHRVGPGDTVNDLSKYYQSDIQKVIEVNDLQEPYTIRVGQRLLLPDGKMPAPPAVTTPSESGPKPAQENDVQTPRDGTALAASIAVPASKPLPRPQGATPEQARFILSAAAAARESQRATGVPASVTIAQAILESFWGGSRLSRENNNYFGIKAKEHPGSAGVVWYDTWEVEGGSNVVRREPFRAYNSMADSFVDHGRFFHQNRRYSAALAASDDPREFARAINRAGYATDPSYAPKLIGLMDRFNLYAYDEDN
jgi:flagellum-specific peptidoglycan hydrolase FlgJ